MTLNALNGLTVTQKNQILSLLDSFDPANQAVINSALANGSPISDNTTFGTSRSAYIARLDQIDPVVAAKIKAGEYQLCDSEIYSVVALGTATAISDLFPQDQAKSTTLRNIANQKLPVEQWFLLQAIEIQYGIDASHSGADSTFGHELIPAKVYAGEIELTQNGRKLISRQSMAAFFQGISAYGVAVGLGATFNARAIMRLDNPKFIKPQEELKGKMEWAYAAGVATSYIKIRLIGTVNERA
ncbi:MAG: hypothetical protein WCK09_15325 [Bacteroidota bacterium]